MTYIGPVYIRIRSKCGIVYMFSGCFCMAATVYNPNLGFLVPVDGIEGIASIDRE